MNKIRILYSTEMWEKFNFFGMRAILVLFMVYVLHYTEKQSALFYGSYLALCYFSPLVGGILADKFIGRRISIILGAAFLALAQLLLFSAGLEMTGLSLARGLTLSALGCVIIGNGFFKPNIAASLASCITERKKMDSIFSAYYFFLNLGALLGQIAVPLLGDKEIDGVRVLGAFKWGFLCAFVAMMIGLITYWIFSKKFPDDMSKKVKINANPDYKRLFLSAAIFVIAFLIFWFFSAGDDIIQKYLYPAIYACAPALSGYILLDKGLSKENIKGVIAVFISCLFIIFFWATAEQAGTSLTFIADNQTNRELFGFVLPPSLIQVFNPLFLVLMASPFSITWAKLSDRGLEPSNINKQAIGMGFMALSFLIIAFNVKNLGDSLLDVKWLILLYFIQVLAEMMIAPIGLALVAKNVPKHTLGLFYGLFYLANAAGYALSGTLAALIPPTTDKFLKAKELGVNLEAVLNGKGSVQDLTLLTQNGLPTEYPTVFGFELTNLFDFFMLFFILCSVAALLLFIIQKFFKDENDKYLHNRNRH